MLTKLDGDARGGAALSVRAVTGKPIKFAGIGEKLDDFDVFHPDRMASRILGMGDVLTLIEKAEESLDAKQAAEMEAKLRRAEFTFEDFLDQLKQVRKMGSLSSILGMLPGVPGMKDLKNVQVDDRQLDRIEAIIFSMTGQERRHPDIIDGSRRRRIARGQRHQRPGRQQSAQAVPRDAEDAQDVLVRQDARVSHAGHERVKCTFLRPERGSHKVHTPLRPTWGRSAPFYYPEGVTRVGSAYQIDPGREHQEPCLPYRRRRFPCPS